MGVNNLIMVGMSGGVDSAVSASMLIEQGFEVEALHMTNWEDDEPFCTAAQDFQDTRQVCRELGITLHHVNFSKEYKEKVFDQTLKEFDTVEIDPNPELKPDDYVHYTKRIILNLSQSSGGNVE